jgi:hypothetical protein
MKLEFVKPSLLEGFTKSRKLHLVVSWILIKYLSFFVALRSITSIPGKKPFGRETLVNGE